MLKDTLAVVHPTDVAFIRLTDGKMNQWFCEGSNTGEYELTSIIQPEAFRTQQHFLYIFNTLGELVIFNVGLPKGGDRNGAGETGGECHLVARIGIPEDFTRGQPIGLQALKGSLTF